MTTRKIYDYKGEVIGKEKVKKMNSVQLMRNINTWSKQIDNMRDEIKKDEQKIELYQANIKEAYAKLEVVKNQTLEGIN